MTVTQIPAETLSKLLMAFLAQVHSCNSFRHCLVPLAVSFGTNRWLNSAKLSASTEKIESLVHQRYGIFVSRVGTLSRLCHSAGSGLEMLVDVPDTGATENPHICLGLNLGVSNLLHAFNGILRILLHET